MSTLYQTPFDKIENYLYYELNGQKRIINSVRVILDESKNEDGTFNPRFLSSIRDAFILYQTSLTKERINNFIVKNKVKATLETFKIDRHLKENELLNTLRAEYVKLNLIRDISSIGNAPKGDSNENDMLDNVFWGNILARNSDYEYVLPLIGNFTLKVFNCFALSILKAEYLFDEKLSINRIEKLRTDLQEEIGHIVNDDSAQLVLILGDYFSAEMFLSDFKTLCDQYLSFNKKIDNLIEKESRSTLGLQSYHDAIRYSAYQNFFESLFIDPQNTVNFIYISRIFPHLFSLILNITYIDHYFCIGEEEMKILLESRVTIEKLRKLFASESSVLNAYLKEHVLKEFVRILDLVSFKIDFLIYKIIDSEKRNSDRKYLQKKLNNYTVIAEECAILFNDYKAKYSDYKLIDLITSDHILTKYFNKNSSNDLLNEFTLFSSLMNSRKKKKLPFSSSFVEYEKEILNSIRFVKNKEKALSHSESIQEKYELGCKDISQLFKNDIISYNEKIVKQALGTFAKSTKYIADLKNIKGKTIEEKKLLFLDIKKFYDEDIEGPFSCPLLIRSAMFVLDFVTELNKNNMYILKSLELQSVMDRILLNLSQVLKHIDNYTYCMNFASLYQDSFYKFTWKDKNATTFSSVTRQSYNSSDSQDTKTLENLAADVFNSSNVHCDNETIFIASTWLNPIGKETLKQTYKYLVHEKNIIITEYTNQLQNYEYNQKIEKLNREYNQQIEIINKDFQKKLEESKKDTVQTLGILAAFLALASSSISGFIACDTPFEYCLVISCVTFCVLSFVASLKSKNGILYDILVLLFIIAFVLALVVYFCPDKAKTPQTYRNVPESSYRK